MEKCAFIDIGTVSVRLALAELEDGQVKSLSKESKICDLGEGVSETGRISQAAKSRVINCVEEYLMIADVMGTKQVACTLTSAARDATNTVELLSELSLRGLIPQVIPGEVEARLSFAGVVSDFPGEKLVVADCGGGSTEISYGPKEDTVLPEWVRSVPVGCRRVTERYLPNNPIDEAALSLAHEFCKLEFSGASLQLNLEGSASKLVVCGGTATSISAMLQELEPYDSDRVHLSTVSREQVTELESRLAPMNLRLRKQVRGLQESRAAVIVGGIVAIAELMDAVGDESFIVSESDLLYGLALSAATNLAGQESPVSWSPEFAQLP